MQPVPRSFQAHRPVLDEAWPAQPPGSPRYDPKQNFRLPLELEILTNRRCALPALLALSNPIMDGIGVLTLGRWAIQQSVEHAPRQTVTILFLLQVGYGVSLRVFPDRRKTGRAGNHEP